MAKSTWGKTSYFHWMWAIRSSRRSNSCGEREVQKRAILRAISRRAAATASALRLSLISRGGRAQEKPRLKIDFWLQECDPRPQPRRFSLARRQMFYRLLVGVTLEAGVSLRPTMGLVTRRTLDRVHLLDR